MPLNGSEPMASTSILKCCPLLSKTSVETETVDSKGVTPAIGMSIKEMIGFWRHFRRLAQRSNK